MKQTLSNLIQMAIVLMCLISIAWLVSTSGPFYSAPVAEPDPPHYKEFIDSCTAEGNPLYLCIDMWREHEH